MLDRRFVWIVLGSLLATATAAAQDRVEGIALSRHDPAVVGSDWHTQESLDLRGDVRWAGGLVLDYARKPLILSSPGGDERAALISDTFIAHLGGALIAWDRARFSLSLPLTLVQEGGSGDTAAGMFVLEDSVAAGDLRLGADVRLFGEYEAPLTLGAGLRIFAPTGSRDSFTSDGSTRAQLKVMVAGLVKPFVYAANLAYGLRTLGENFAGDSTGSELQFGAAAGLRLADDKLTVGPELTGATVITSSDAAFGRRTSNVELLFGGHYLAGDWVKIGAGIGPGLSRGFGTPELRVLLSAAIVQPVKEPPPPPPPPSDRDGDGIIDADDACPDEPGPPTGDPTTHGCPPPSDRDGDGIIDDEDACPDEPGVATDDPKTNGCPPPKDTDGDGVVDPEDACPDVPGVATDDPKTNGCPADTDGDGIIDPEDACPNDPGPANEDPKKHGCPAARVEKGQIRILEQVQFKLNRSDILPESTPILEAVLKILTDHPEITEVLIQGHTDNQGKDRYNLRLSTWRAREVKRWLTKHGISKKRLRSEGRGETQPIETNDTEEGRAINRRVEFHIVGKAEPEGESAESTGESAKPADAEEQ